MITIQITLHVMPVSDNWQRLTDDWVKLVGMCDPFEVQIPNPSLSSIFVLDIHNGSCMISHFVSNSLSFCCTVGLYDGLIYGKSGLDLLESLKLYRPAVNRIIEKVQETFNIPSIKKAFEFKDDVKVVTDLPQDITSKMTLDDLHTLVDGFIYTQDYTLIMAELMLKHTKPVKVFSLYFGSKYYYVMVNEDEVEELNYRLGCIAQQIMVKKLTFNRDSSTS